MDYMSDIWALVEINRYQEAKVRIESALLKEPANAELYFVAAIVEDQIGTPYETHNIVCEGLSLAPTHQGLRYLYFDVLKTLGDLAEAEEVIISLLREAPANPRYLCGYADLMMVSYHLEKARALCDEALRVAPEHEEANRLSYLLNLCLGKSELSDEELRGIIDNDPESEQTLSLIAVDLIEKKKFRQAQPILHELIRVDPNNEDIVESIVDVRVATHWTSIPCWPLNRYGWVASIGAWFVFVVTFRFFGESFDDDVVLFVAILYITWVVYSWVQPPILKSWLLRRGV